MSPTNHDHDGSNSDEEISDDFDAEDSDVEYEEEEEEAASAEEPPLKKVKGGDGKPRKAPTAEEMAHLKETQNLFQSNLFRMQVCLRNFLVIWASIVIGGVLFSDNRIDF